MRLPLSPVQGIGMGITTTQDDLIKFKVAVRNATELLVKDIGLNECSSIIDRSTTVISRYYSSNLDEADRSIPIHLAMALERHASFPYVTKTMADFLGITFSSRRTGNEKIGHLSKDVITLTKKFADLISEYQQAIEDDVISKAEAKRLLQEVSFMQKIILDMKVHLQADTPA